MNDLLKYFDQYLIRKDIKVIVECGARDCEDTLKMFDIFPNAEIYTFECNPNTLPLCCKNIKDKSRIHLIENALSNVTGFISFYPINKEKTRTTWEDGNQGASSIFKASGKYPIENYVQDEITVQSYRLDSFNIIPDLLWLDAQGAELSILQGLGSKLKDVKFIQTEVEMQEIYEGQPLFPDVLNFLEKNNFIFLGFGYRCDWFADAYFINKLVIT
jgi:FkbM family methyltransferase